MASVFRSTVNPYEQFRDEMDRLLTGFFGQVPEWSAPGTVRGQPAVNVWESEDAVMVESEVPGLKSDQLDISVIGDELTLKIDRPEEPEEGVTYHRRERPVGAFTRIIELPSDVDANRVQAELRDGVLRITLPKAETARPRKISVTAG
jgi:HSP20 family protein